MATREPDRPLQRWMIARDRSASLPLSYTTSGDTTRWRLTYLTAPHSNLPPTNDWQRWAPSGNKSRAQFLTTAGAKNEPPLGNTDFMGVVSAPAPTETSHVSSFAAGSISAPQINCHRQGAKQGISEGRKQANSAGGVSNDQPSDDLLDALRDRLHAYLAGAGVGAQTQLASAAGIPGGTLSKFNAGRGLSARHFVSLQLALNKAAPSREAA
jgi:hypothetical protein